MSKIKFVFLWSFLIVSFSIAGLMLMVQALGYQVDWRKLKIQKTGVICFKFSPADGQIFLEDKSVLVNQRGCLEDLLPGRYDLEIRAEGYQTWSTQAEVKEGVVTSFEAIELFLAEPIISPASPEEKAKLAKVIEPPDIKVIDGTEIRVMVAGQEKLVTRFSYPVSQVQWFPDKKHLAYLAQGELRIIELDGANNQRLIKFDPAPASDQPVRYFFQADGQELIFQLGAEGAEAPKARVQ